MNNLRIASTLLSAVFFVASCGSSGGGDNPVVNFSKNSDIPKTGTTNFKGTSRSISYNANSANVVTSTSAISGPNAASASLETKDSVAVALRIKAPGANASFDRDSGDTFTQNGNVIGVVSANQQNYATIVDGASAGFEYQTFGAWDTGYGTGSGKMAAGSFGAKTAASGMPNVGTNATYNGASVGYVTYNDGVQASTISNIVVDTDFATATIDSSNTNVVVLETGATRADSNLDFNGGGPVSGTGFSASVSASTTSGTANGQFYGPTAQEVGGTFGLTGGATTYIGSFGARK